MTLSWIDIAIRALYIGGVVGFGCWFVRKSGTTSEFMAAGGALPGERLPLHDLSEIILGLPIRKVVIPVTAGRNLAVLLEAAVRSHVLQLRGINTTAEFIERQQAEIKKQAV